jgi:hypothetical protein
MLLVVRIQKFIAEMPYTHERLGLKADGTPTVQTSYCIAAECETFSLAVNIKADWSAREIFSTNGIRGRS